MSFDRVFLAGDAAHLNNPLGGMGMNGGIHDALNLAEKLTKVWKGAPLDSMGRYERQRRKAALEAVQAQTLRNRRDHVGDAIPQRGRPITTSCAAPSPTPRRTAHYLLRVLDDQVAARPRKRRLRHRFDHVTIETGNRPWLTASAIA